MSSERRTNRARLPILYAAAALAVILTALTWMRGGRQRETAQPDPAARRPRAEQVTAPLVSLHDHRDWDAIVAVLETSPPKTAAERFILMEAHMNRNEDHAVAAMAEAELARRDADPRLLQPLFFMAAKRGFGKWEKAFAQYLERCLPGLHQAEQLYPLVQTCFHLARPDLAWRVLNRISEIDRQHPALPLAAALHARNWFVFRKKSLGIAALDDHERIHFGAAGERQAHARAWQALPRPIPFESLLATDNLDDIRSALLGRALDGFQTRHADGTLSPFFLYAFARALELAERPDEAYRLLQRTARSYPEESLQAELVLSEIQARRGDWQNVYETLRSYPQKSSAPRIEPLLRLSEAQIRLRLGTLALHTARQAARQTTHVTLPVKTLARALSLFDSPEEALWVLEQPRLRSDRELLALEAAALRDTQRFRELESFARTARLAGPGSPAPESPQSALPPAEQALRAHRTTLPPHEAFEAHLRHLMQTLPDTTSPFLLAMHGLWIQCFREAGEGKAAAAEPWASAGRDRFEKAEALRQLTLLLCRFGKHDAARQAIAQACRHFPESPLLWRLYIGLSDGEPEVVQEARCACPRDSEIWLSDLVSLVRNPASAGASPPGATNQTADASVQRRVRRLVADAIRETFVTPAAMTRAADFCLRSGFIDAASDAAQDAVERARGLLPAYVTGWRCAVDRNDPDRALRCVRLAIAASVRPDAHLYASLVRLRIATDARPVDAEMVDSLRMLRRLEPEETAWSVMLGYVRFRRGGMDLMDAVRQSSQAIDAGARSKAPFVVAAEASRLLGNPERAAAFLEQGLARFPGDTTLLNNLAHTLSFVESRRNEALDMIANLLLRVGDEPRILDTATAVFLQSGLHAEARNLIARQRTVVPHGKRMWFRSQVHEARIALETGDPHAAIDIVTQGLRDSSGIEDTDLDDAKKILSQARDRIARRRRLTRDGRPARD